MYTSCFDWPAKTSVSPRSSPLGTFREEETAKNFGQDFNTQLFFIVRTATATTGSLPLTHILPLSSLRWKVFHFLLSRVNKLALVNIVPCSPPPPPPEEDRDCFYLISQLECAKMAGISNRVYLNIWNLFQSRTYLLNSLPSILGNFGKMAKIIKR